MLSSKKLNNLFLFGLIFFIFYFKIIIEIFFFNVPFSHDTLATFQIFTFNFNNFFNFSKFPIWLDYVDHGQPALFSSSFFYPGIFFPIIVVSSFLDISSLNSFIIGVSLINLFFIFGIYLNISKFKNKNSIIIFIALLYCFLIDTSFIIHSYAFWSITIPFGVYYFNKFFIKKKLSDLLNFSIIFLSYMIIYTTYYHIFSFYILVLLFSLFLFFHMYKEKGEIFKIRFQKIDFIKIIIILILILVAQYYFNYINENYFFSTQGERTIDGNVTLNDLIYYANYPYLVKLYKFLQNGLFQNEYGFQYTLFFFYLLIFYLFQKNKIYFKEFLILIFTIIFFFIISNSIDFKIGRYILNFLYNYFPGINKFRHSGYLINLTLPLLLIVIAIILENFFENNKNNFSKKNILISFLMGLIFLFGYFFIDQFKTFFVFSLINIGILFFAFSNYLRKKNFKNNYIILYILLISTLPFYIYSILQVEKDNDKYLINLINNSKIVFNYRCVDKGEIDKEYKTNNLPGIKSSFFFLVSENKPCHSYYKTSVYGSKKKHTESISTKGGSEIYFTTLNDLIILSNFIKNYIKSSKFNEAQLTNLATVNLNIEPKTFYFRVTEIGKFLNPKIINNLKWPENFRYSLNLIIENENEIIFSPDKFNLFTDNNTKKNLYLANELKIKKINNEKFYIKNSKKFDNIDTFITFSHNWIIRDNKNNLLKNKIINKNGYLTILEIKKLEEFYLIYQDTKAFKIQLIILIISSIFIVNLLFQIIKRKI